MKGLAGPEHCANCLIDRESDGLARRLRSSDHSRRTSGGTCASKHTGDRYGPQADCRRYRLAAQAAQCESREPTFPRHPHERGAQTDAARLRGSQKPQRTFDQVQRPRRARPEQTKQLTFARAASRGSAIGARRAPRIRLPRPLPAYSTLTLLALTTLAQRSDSLLICSPRRSGAPPTRRSPASSRRFLMREFWMAALSAAFSFSTAARGVPCGAMKPYQGP